MNTNPQAITAMSAITISREYGSGGGEIAARLAHRLGWQLIDHAIIEQTALSLEVRESEVEKHDEDYIESDRPGILSRILEQLTPSATATGGGGIFMRPACVCQSLAGRSRSATPGAGRTVRAGCLSHPARGV